MLRKLCILVCMAQPAFAQQGVGEKDLPDRALDDRQCARGIKTYEISNQIGRRGIEMIPVPCKPPTPGSIKVLYNPYSINP